MEGAVEVGAGVRDHLDLADLELRAGRIPLPRFFAAQVVTNERGGESLVRHHAVVDGLARADRAALGSGRAPIARSTADCASIAAEAHSCTSAAASSASSLPA